MKKFNILILAALLYILIVPLKIYAQGSGCAENKKKPVAALRGDQGNGTFLNPVLPGDYPDPSVVRVGSDYYMVNSSMYFMPGLLIWHSKDLINWKPVGFALHKFIGDIWAPDITFYKGLYYIYFPSSGTNYVITAQNPAGPWSDPVDLKVGNIDPYHVVDKNGKRYLFLSKGTIVPLSEDGLSIAGKPEQVYDGWKFPESWLTECKCLEGPKITYRNGYYYLLNAEGGTAGPATSHMVIVARSESLYGPWKNSPYNPLIRTSSRRQKWWSVGHGSLIETPSGRWWMIFHGYENGLRTLGRQVLLAPVVWTKDGWPKVKDDFCLAKPYKKPEGTDINKSTSLSDNFNESRLKFQWRYFGNQGSSDYTTGSGELTIKAKGKDVSTGSVLACMPRDESYLISAEAELHDSTRGGLLLYYNPDNYVGIGLNGKEIIAWLYHQQRKVAEHTGNKLYLKIINIHNEVSMYYGTDGKKWIKYDRGLDVSFYNQNALRGFLSLKAALYGSGKGRVTFKNFVYKKLNRVD